LFGRLEGPVELGEGDDRHVDIPGQNLQTSGELRHFDLAVLRSALTGRHQLQVVDDDETEVAVLRLEAAAFGPHVHHGQVGVVVDEQRRLGQTSPVYWSRIAVHCAGESGVSWPR